MALQVEGTTICPTPASWAGQNAFNGLSVVYFEIHMYHSDNHSQKEYLTEEVLEFDLFLYLFT